MKKLTIIGTLALAIISLCSCEKINVVQGVEWCIEDFEVKKWDYSNNAREPQANNYFYATFDWPSLTRFICTDGIVQAYLVTGEGSSEQQRQLTYSEPVERFYQNPDGTEDRKFYTETYTYTYGEGWIEFQFRASDFGYEDTRDPEREPLPCKFRVVLQW